MILETFFERFDQFAEAPNAVAKLRELVLQLAVQGKLVEQDADDEPASDLLERVRGERRQLADKGSLKTKVHLPQVGADDQPYVIPETWLWVPLNEITELVYGKLLPTSDLLPKGFPVFGANGIIGFFSKYLYKDEMLLISCRGAYSGTPNISPPNCFVTNNSIVCEFFDPTACDIRFFHSVISVSPRKRIVTGSAQPQVTVANAIKLPVPLPPLAEQKRIVAKVDELMALCDRLEAQQQERETRHAALSRASLARFADAPTPANLNYLFHPSFNIHPSDLRKSILTLAVQGKLVPQDPTDEPAEKLIARIASTKLELQKAGEIGKEKPLEPLHLDRLPFEVPDSWRWAKLAELTELITKGSSPKWQGIAYVSESEGILFITSENVGNYVLRKLDDLKYVSKGFNEIEPRSILKRGDILMNLVGASIGRTAVYDLPDGANINQAVALIRLVRETDGICPRYLLHYLNSPAAIDYMLSSRVVSAQPNISLTDAREFAIPLPPLAEQKRIVAKVDQLMALVEELETQLAAARKTAEALMEAAVAELTGWENCKG